MLNSILFMFSPFVDCGVLNLFSSTLKLEREKDCRLY
jgi:hypothetical protein